MLISATTLVKEFHECGFCARTNTGQHEVFSLQDFSRDDIESDWNDILSRLIVAGQLINVSFVEEEREVRFISRLTQCGEAALEGATLGCFWDTEYRGFDHEATLQKLRQDDLSKYQADKILKNNDPAMDFLREEIMLLILKRKLVNEFYLNED